MGAASCLRCGTEVIGVLDKAGKVDHWIDRDGHATATDIPDAYERRAELGRDPHNLAAMQSYSALSVRLQLGMSFHQHQGVAHA